MRLLRRIAGPGRTLPMLADSQPRPEVMGVPADRYATFDCQCGGTCGHCTAVSDAATTDDHPESIAASAGDGTPSDRWHAYGIVEGLRTTDGRGIAMNSGVWRDLPLPIAWAKQNEGGHWGSVVVGSVTLLERQERDGYALVYAEGTWDLGSEEGAECARQVELQGGTRFVSADMEIIDSDWIMVDGGGGEDDLYDMLFGEADWYQLITSYRIAGLTVVSTPAFPQCVIAPAGVPLVEVEPLGDTSEPAVQPMLVASAVVPPDEPPAAWFDNPTLTAPTPLTVGDDGRVYGHLAVWGTCHTGFRGECVTPPRGTDYRYFRTGTVRTADGQDIPVGQLTVDCGHASGDAGHRAAAAHYDHAGHAAADVAAGDDTHGIWVAGAVRPGATEDQIRMLRASALSGDWRTIAGRLELVAALAVNVPGFPVPRSLAAAAVDADLESVRPRAHVHDGKVMSLVAAGRVVRNPLRDVLSAMASKVQTLEERIRDLEAPTLMASLEAELG